jgi:hypothetical protein
MSGVSKRIRASKGGPSSASEGNLPRRKGATPTRTQARTQTRTTLMHRANEHRANAQRELAPPHILRPASHGYLARPEFASPKCCGGSPLLRLRRSANCRTVHSRCLRAPPSRSPTRQDDECGGSAIPRCSGRPVRDSARTFAAEGSRTAARGDVATLGRARARSRSRVVCGGRLPDRSMSWPCLK